MGKRVALLFNSIAGRGQAARRAQQLAVGLRAFGHEPISVEFGPAAPRDAINEHDDLAAMVVVGGDGSVRMASTIAVQRDLPLWQSPCGTENLFAREFGMVRDAGAIAAALEAGRVRRMDLGVIDGQPFTLMASVGYDASVVHRLARVRKGAISHLSYLRPMIAELASLRPPTVSVRVDGQSIIEGRSGMLVVANCKQYAMRLNPASDAAVNDGLLDVVFLPHTTRLGLAGWMIDTLRSKHLDRRRSVFRRGEAVEIIAHDQALCFQVDGDALLKRETEPAEDSSVADAMDRALITVRHAALPVLLPAVDASAVLVPPRGAEATAAA